MAYVAKLDPPWPLFGFFLLIVLHNASIAAILARIASDLGGSPVVGPSLFKAGIVLSFLARSFLSSGLGAIEALILSYSLRPRCPFVIFVFLVFVRPGTLHTSSNAAVILRTVGYFYPPPEE